MTSSHTQNAATDWSNTLCFLFQSEGGGAFKGFKGFSLSATGDGSSAPTAFSGFGAAPALKGFGGLINGNNNTPTFGGFTATPAATTTAAPGEDRLLIGWLVCDVRMCVWSCVLMLKIHLLLGQRSSQSL